jgi:hypothetical protein
MKFRQHRGSLVDSMATVVEIEPTREALASAIVASLDDAGLEATGLAELIRCAPYGYDARIGWKTHIVTIRGVPGVWGFTDCQLIDHAETPAYDAATLHSPGSVAREKVTESTLVTWNAGRLLAGCRPAFPKPAQRNLPMFELSTEWRIVSQCPINRWPAVVLEIGGNHLWRKMYADETLPEIAQATSQPGMPLFKLLLFPTKAHSDADTPERHLVYAVGPVSVEKNPDGTFAAVLTGGGDAL